MKPWWQLPTWTRSNDCGNVCLLLLSLKKQRSQPHRSQLLAIIARHVAPCLRPPVLLAVHRESGLRVIEEESGAERVCLPSSLISESEVLAYAPTCDRVAVGTDSTVHLFDFFAGTSMMQCHVGDHEVCSLAFSPTDKYLAVGLQGGTIAFVDVEIGIVQRSLLLLDRPNNIDVANVEGEVVSMVYSHTGERLAAMVFWGKEGCVCEYFVQVVDVQAGSVLWRESCSDDVFRCHIDYSPDGALVAYSYIDGGVLPASPVTKVTHFTNT